MLENSNFDAAKRDGLSKEIISAGKRATISKSEHFCFTVYTIEFAKIVKKLSRGKIKLDQDSAGLRRLIANVVNTQISP